MICPHDKVSIWYKTISHLGYLRLFPADAFKNIITVTKGYNRYFFAVLQLLFCLNN